MSLYTLVFILITLFVLIGLVGFFFMLQWIDKKVDKRDRLNPERKKKGNSEN